MRAGQLRYVGRLERPAAAATSPSGERVEGGWDVAATGMWCRVRPASSAGEKLAEGRVRDSASHVVEIRWIDGVDPTWRLVLPTFGPAGATFSITHAEDPTGKRRELVLAATING